MITPKQRLKRILSKEQIDRPCCICPGGMMNMITADLMKEIDVYLPEAHRDARMMAQLAEAVYDKGCFENYGVPFCMTVEAEAMGAPVDFGSDIYEPHVMKYVIESVEDYKKLTPLDPTTGRAKIVLDAIKILKEETKDVPIVGNITGPVSTASSMMEPVVFYKQLRKKNKESHEYMEFICEQLKRFGLEQIKAGADVITISDPSGTGEILGPKLFEEFAVKYINELVDAFEACGVKTIVHICGHMNSVYREVNKIRSDALSFDSVVSMKQARENLGDRVLMGNVSTYALEFAGEDKIETLTKHCVKSGSDIISPACGLGMKSPLHNVQAILKTLEDQ